MAVPTPIAHWTLYDNAGATTIVDEINGYEADVSTSSGSGGDFGATGRGNGETGFQNTTGNTSTIAPDLIASPALATDFNGNLGTVSVWAKVTQQGASNLAWQFTFDGFTNTNTLFFENAAASNQPSAIASPGGTLTWEDTTTWPGEWLLWIVTWSKADNRMRLYVNDTLIGSIAYPGTTGSTDMGSNGNNIVGTGIAIFQDVKIWNVELSQDEISELYAEATPCNPTIPADQLAFMWDIAESKMPCVCTIQKQGILGWEAIATDQPCSLEKLAPRRQWDETNQVWVTDEAWAVTISGRTTLPLPGVFNAVRFQVLGMTLESYEFYQSPDDIMTTLECRKV